MPMVAIPDYEYYNTPFQVPQRDVTCAKFCLPKESQPLTDASVKGIWIAILSTTVVDDPIEVYIVRWWPYKYTCPYG